jgi:hypothetical protein
LGLANRAIESGIPFGQEEGLIDTQGVQDFLRSTAQAAIVLLKNEASLLPLQPKKFRRLAVIGPNAKLQVLSGGGSASLRAIRSSSPLEGILAAAEKESIQVEYTPGVFAHRYLPLVNPLVRSARGGQGHLDLEFFETDPTQPNAEVQAIHSLSVDTATNFMVSTRSSTMSCDRKGVHVSHDLSSATTCPATYPHNVICAYPRRSPRTALESGSSVSLLGESCLFTQVQACSHSDRNSLAPFLKWPSDASFERPACSLQPHATDRGRAVLAERFHRRARTDRAGAGPRVQDGHAVEQFPPDQPQG